MTLKNTINTGILFIIIAVVFVFFGIILPAVQMARMRDNCISNMSDVISFNRTTDESGRIHYFASIVRKDGEVCYDIELTPSEFYRLKAEHEPLVH